MFTDYKQNYKHLYIFACNKFQTNLLVDKIFAMLVAKKSMKSVKISPSKYLA